MFIADNRKTWFIESKQSKWIHCNLNPALSSIQWCSRVHSVEVSVQKIWTRESDSCRSKRLDSATYETRSTETVHTSAKARLISVAIRIRIRFRLPNTLDPTDPDRHQNLIVCSLVHCQPFLKISCKSVAKFSRTVLNRQTDKQTNDDYISSLGKVTNYTQRNFSQLQQGAKIPLRAFCFHTGTSWTNAYRRHM